MTRINTYEEYWLYLAGIQEPHIFQAEVDVNSFMQDVDTPGTLKKIVYTETTVRTYNAGELTPKTEKKMFKDINQIGVYKVKEE